MSSLAQGEGVVKIMAFGDSLSAGFGLPEKDGFVPVLESELRDAGIEAIVRNASVSGATTTDGRVRLEYALKWNPDVIILELGANDALRAFPPEVASKNIDSMLQTILSRDIKVLLAGMYAPPNLGEEYGKRFNSIYPEMAKKHGVALYPFFLDGVALTPNLMLDDGVHPNSEGIRVVVEKILPYVLSVIRT